MDDLGVKIMQMGSYISLLKFIILCCEYVRIIENSHTSFARNSFYHHCIHFTNWWCSSSSTTITIIHEHGHCLSQDLTSPSKNLIANHRFLHDFPHRKPLCKPSSSLWLLKPIGLHTTQHLFHLKPKTTFKSWIFQFFSSIS